MARSSLLALLLVSALLCVSFSQGHGRRVKTMRTSGRGLSSQPSHEENSWVVVGRAMVEMVMDYNEPGPNTNPRNGALFNAPTPTSPSRHY